jgi:hypothetical protein
MHALRAATLSVYAPDDPADSDRANSQLTAPDWACCRSWRAGIEADRLRCVGAAEVARPPTSYRLSPGTCTPPFRAAEYWFFPRSRPRNDRSELADSAARNGAMSAASGRGADVSAENAVPMSFAAVHMEGIMRSASLRRHGLVCRREYGHDWPASGARR